MNHVDDLKTKEANKEDKCEICERVAVNFTEVRFNSNLRRLFVCDDCLEIGLETNSLRGVK